jgi:hypothetical protein
LYAPPPPLYSFKQSIITSIREDNSYPPLPPSSEFRSAPTLPRPLSPPLRRDAFGAKARSPLRSGGAPSSAGGGYGSPYASSYAQPSHAPPPTSVYAPRASSSPPRGGAAAAYVDGKDFFRLARSRLSYEDFNRFLANIKSLNDHAQDRDETLEQARTIFGPSNQDLFLSFRSLLAHHGLV